MSDLGIINYSCHIHNESKAHHMPNQVCTLHILGFLKSQYCISLFGCAWSALLCGLSSLWWAGFLSSSGAWASLCGGFSCCAEQALGCADFSSCSSMTLEHRLSSCGPQGLIAPSHVGSSQIKDRTCVSCDGRQILYHWATRKSPSDFLILAPKDPFLQMKILTCPKSHSYTL